MKGKVQITRTNLANSEEGKVRIRTEDPIQMRTVTHRIIKDIQRIKTIHIIHMNMGAMVVVPTITTIHHLVQEDQVDMAIIDLINIIAQVMAAILLINKLHKVVITQAALIKVATIRDIHHLFLHMVQTSNSMDNGAQTEKGLLMAMKMFRNHLKNLEVYHLTLDQGKN